MPAGSCKPMSLCLIFISINFSFCLSRLNSIDVKYQMWKLGVVFTDNVSPLHYHKVKCTLITGVCWASADGKMVIEESYSNINSVNTDYVWERSMEIYD